MTIVKVKPTSAGRRGMVKIVTPGLHKGKPVAALTESNKRGSGRNNNGHITTRHRGGGHKAHYRVVDFRRDKDGIAAKVERLEYDPNRSAHLALLCYADGERRYILAPRGVQAGDQLMSGSQAPIRAGNSMPIRNIPVGSTIHCRRLRFAQAIRCPYAISPWAPQSIALRCFLVKVRKWRDRRELPRACWPAKVHTHRSGFGQVKFGASTLSVAQPWEKWATKSTACGNWARQGLHVGVAFGQRSVVKR